MFPQSEDYVFYKAIEAEFIRLRVTPLQLSPDDFQIAKAWRMAAVPLELVLEVLAGRVEAQRQKGQEVKRRLSYYRKAVLSAWEKRQELLAPAARTAAPRIDVERRLAVLADGLPESLALVAEAVRALAGEPGEVEASLESLETRAFAALRAGLSPEDEAELRREIEAATADLRQRLPEDQLTRVRQSLERQLLRQRAHLPAFSIFAD